MKIKVDKVGKINEVFAWVVDDPEHGVLGITLPDLGSIPTMCTTLKNAQYMKEWLLRTNTAVGKFPIKLMHFTSEGIFVIDEIGVFESECSH